jgi:CRISPR-associated protein Cas1
MLPTLGIFHRNKYNAYCLADDIMGPYQAYVDFIVCRYYGNYRFEELNIDKKQLLSIVSINVFLSTEETVL